MTNHLINLYVGALGSLPAEARIVLLLGNRGSDHLRELQRIAEFRGRAAYRIESEAELQPRWFVGAAAVGLVLGAAGLEELLARVTVRLREFEAAARRGLLEGNARLSTSGGG